MAEPVKKTRAAAKLSDLREAGRRVRLVTVGSGRGSGRAIAAIVGKKARPSLEGPLAIPDSTGPSSGRRCRLGPVGKARARGPGEAGPAIRRASAEVAAPWITTETSSPTVSSTGSASAWFKGLAKMPPSDVEGPIGSGPRNVGRPGSTIVGAPDGAEYGVEAGVARTGGM